MKVRYFEQALDELTNCIIHYSDIDPHLGAYAETDIMKSIKFISKFPKGGNPHQKYNHLRIRSCEKFPNSIIYHFKEEERIIYIIAIAHQKRHPDYWKSRF